MAENSRAYSGEAAEPSPSAPSAAPSTSAAEADAARATARAALGFLAGAVMIVACAFALPQLDSLIRSYGTVVVVVVFTVDAVVAGWLFWSRAEKLYGLLTT